MKAASGVQRCSEYEHPLTSISISYRGQGQRQHQASECRSIASQQRPFSLFFPPRFHNCISPGPRFTPTDSLWSPHTLPLSTCNLTDSAPILLASQRLPATSTDKTHLIQELFVRNYHIMAKKTFFSPLLLKAVGNRCA